MSKDVEYMMPQGDRSGARETVWRVPFLSKPAKNKSKRYSVSETQLRQLFCMRFAPLDFNRDYVREFIDREELTEVNE